MSDLSKLRSGYDRLKQGTLWSSTGKCKGFAASNPGEAFQIDKFVTDLVAGESVTVPSLATATGQGIVEIIAGGYVTSIIPPPDPDPDPVPPPVSTGKSTGIATGYPSYAGYWTAQELDNYFSGIVNAGFKKVRLDYVTGAGSVGDKAVNAARARGLAIQLIVLGSSADTQQVYTSRVQAAVNQYKDRVSEWQLMNEPNLPSKGWTNGAAYAMVAGPSYAAIKSLQPQSIVHLGSIAQYGGGATNTIDKSYPINWLRSVYSLSGNFFDEVDIHPYNFYRNISGAQSHVHNQAWQQMCGDGAYSIRQTMVDNGDSNKKISITEYGHPTWLSPWTATAYPSAIGMDEQAARDSTALAIADFKTRPYLRDFYVYSFRNRAPKESATVADMQGYFGLLRGDGSFKPSYSLWVAENPNLNT